MPLESLDNQINIGDLTLEQEKTPMPEWQKQYERIKAKKFYDKDGEYFRAFENDDDIAFTETNLLSIWIESFIDKEEAKEELDHLKTTLIYLDGIWQDGRSPNFSIIYDTETNVDNTLLGINLEAKFNPKETKGKLWELKNTKIYNRVMAYNDYYGLWQGTIDKQDTSSGYFPVESQFLAIMAEAKYDRDAAYERYQKLEELGFYDKENDLWYNGLEVYRQWVPGAGGKDKYVLKPSGNKQVCAQLYGIMCLAIFDLEAARKRFERLKADEEYYDKENEMWDVQGAKYKMTDPQLVGVLCEQLFEKKPSKGGLNTPPLPETRKY